MVWLVGLVGYGNMDCMDIYWFCWCWSIGLV